MTTTGSDHKRSKIRFLKAFQKPIPERTLSPREEAQARTRRHKGRTRLKTCLENIGPEANALVAGTYDGLDRTLEALGTMQEPTITDHYKTAKSGTKEDEAKILAKHAAIKARGGRQ